ncbi:MAG: DUF2062 domain-containing protein [Pseudomonadota bacterium]
MLFRRREPAPWHERLRVWLWPRRSWMRSSQYFTKRVLRLTASPHAIAAGIAAGVLSSYTPFLGAHFIIAALLAWLLAGNIIASAIGTWFGNPLTFPLIWIASYASGQFLIEGKVETAGIAPQIGDAMAMLAGSIGSFDFDRFATAMGEIWNPLIKPMLVGGIPLGIISAGIAYFLTRRATIYFRESRRQKLLEKARAVKLAAHHSAQSVNRPADAAE